MPARPMKHPALPKRLAQDLAAAPLAAAFFYGALGVNLAQIAGKAIKPVAPVFGAGLGGWSYGAWVGALSELSRALFDAQIAHSGDLLPSPKRALILVNHQGMMDIPVLMSAAHQVGRGSALRWYAKDVLRYIPAIGWALPEVAVMLKRDWSRDQATVEAAFAALNASNCPHWLVSFSEGTRLTPEKLSASNAFAESRGLPPLKHVLYPRPTGFIASVGALRSRLDAVLDLTIGYPDGVPSLEHFVTGGATRFALHTRVHSPAALPKDSDKLALWLQTRFQEKDALLDGFYQTGSF